MPNVWKVIGKGGKRHDLQSHDYFVEHNCASCGWSFDPIQGTKLIDEKSLESFKDFFSKAEINTEKPHKWGHQGVHTLFEKVKPGDFLWTRIAGEFYVAKVQKSSVFRYDNSAEAHKFDCSPQLTNIKWKKVGTIEKVPGSISTYCGNRGAIYQVDKNERTKLGGWVHSLQGGQTK